jgi:hypothetical protein
MAAHFFGYWVAAFVTLCLGLVLLSVFYRLIDSELGLHGLGKEAAIAGVASFFQGLGAWLIFTYAPGAGRAMLIPGLMAAIIYKLSHLSDWSGYEMGGIFLFQMVLWSVGALLFSGEFKIALAVLLAFGIGLSIIASLAKTL